MRYKSVLLFGAPGSGKGTQGKILGAVPGFYHSACGDVFLRTSRTKIMLPSDFDIFAPLRRIGATCTQ